MPPPPPIPFQPPPLIPLPPLVDDFDTQPSYDHKPIAGYHIVAAAGLYPPHPSGYWYPSVPHHFPTHQHPLAQPYLPTQNYPSPAQHFDPIHQHYHPTQYYTPQHYLPNPPHHAIHQPERPDVLSQPPVVAGCNPYELTSPDVQTNGDKIPPPPPYCPEEHPNKRVARTKLAGVTVAQSPLHAQTTNESLTESPPLIQPARTTQPEAQPEVQPEFQPAPTPQTEVQPPKQPVSSPQSRVQPQASSVATPQAKAPPPTRSTAQRATRPLSKYFSSMPASTWSLRRYLEFPYETTPHIHLEGWRKSLESILVNPSSSPEWKAKAAVLLDQYKGSNAKVGRQWLEQQTKPRARKRKRAAAAGNTIHGPNAVHIGPISFHNNVINSFPARLPLEDSNYDASYINMPYDPPTVSNTTMKWTLSSGTVVEDIVATACNKNHYPPRALIRSFILDLSDPHIRSLFTPKDWTEITASISPLPAASTSFLRSLPITSSLSVFERALLDLRIERATNGSFSDRDLWLFSVLDRMTLLFRHPDALRQQHLELWYDMHIWSRVIDDAFFGSKTFFLERREGICVSTSERRNRHRTTTTNNSTTTTNTTTRPPRHRLGTRLDGILRLTHSPRTELGAIETARAFTGENSTKWLSDSTKLSRTLHDMLVHLNRETRGDARVLRKLQTVGIVNAGRAMQVKRLAWIAGAVCVLKTEERVGVPVEVGGVVELVRVLEMVERVREVVEETGRAVREAEHGEREGGRTVGDVMSEKGERVELGWFVDTDPESRD